MDDEEHHPARLPLGMREEDVKPAIRTAILPMLPGEMRLDVFEKLVWEIYDIVVAARRNR